MLSDYLQRHPEIRQDMTMMVRMMEPDPQHKTIVRFQLEASVEGQAMRQIFEMRLKPETGEMTVATGA